MITAVDSSVLIDILVADIDFGLASSRAIRLAMAEGSLIACDVVAAEVASYFADGALGPEALRTLDVRYEPLSEDAVLLAGRTWRAYRARGGRRDRLVGDFLIGAHAQAQAHRLLTRDRGFYRTYFKDLEILDPSQP